jgi:hypothetical protein
VANDGEEREETLRTCGAASRSHLGNRMHDDRRIF